VGRVLDELQRLGLDDNTIVVVWSDHGFLLGEHGMWGKHCLYEQALRSPLLIRNPGLPQPGHASHAVVETVDLFPTLTDLCGLPTPSGLDGHSLLPQLKDPEQPTDSLAFGYWTGGRRCVRTARWRLIVHPRKDLAGADMELFDYQSDPDETRNHAAEHPAVVAELLKSLGTAPEPTKR
jgi:iduronate 2-sulfatase